MGEERETSRSRRSLLTAGIATGAAIVAAEVLAPSAANAANGDTLLLGSAANAATATTELDATFGSTKADGLLVKHDSTADLSSGVHGYATATALAYAYGVLGETDAEDGSGVVGWANNPTGYNAGVEGDAYGVDAVGVYGWNGSGGNGVQGISDASYPASGSHNTGVHGYSVSPGTAAIGVRGQSASGTGVRGEATSGTGVVAQATTGTALRVSGKAKFSRSGRASVAAGHYYVDVTVAGGLAANSVVHATLQTYRPGVAIAAVRTNYPVSGKARIYLTKVASTTAATSVGWFAAEY